MVEMMFRLFSLPVAMVLNEKGPGRTIEVVTHGMVLVCLFAKPSKVSPVPLGDVFESQVSPI